MSKLLAAIREGLERAAEQGVSRATIARESGVSEAALSRFVHGERGLGVELVEKLADCLEIEIIVRHKRKRKDR